MDDKLVIKIDGEDIYFQKKEQEKIKALREAASHENDKKYREDHKHHCFRCGTKSLVEVRKGDIVVDICVNEGCGAVHLDPGELEIVMKKGGTVGDITKAVFGIFK
jgi:hypothetical protein